MEKYSCDEMAGFEEIPRVRARQRNDLIWTRTTDLGVRFSLAALRALGDPVAVRVKVNPERKVLLVYKTDDLDPDGLVLRKEGGRTRCRVNSLAILKLLERLTGKALDVVNLTAPGEASKKLPNALFFDFSKAYVKKGR